MIVQFQAILNYFKEIFLSFISLHINFCPEWVCMTQRNTKQLPTHSDPHILVPSVIPFCIDICGKSLSRCCSASLTKQRCQSSNDSLSFFSNWGLQSNYQDNQTCVWVSQCHWHVTFLQEQILVIHTSGHLKGHSQKHWNFFLHKFVKPSSVKRACFNSFDVMREHIGMWLERSSKRHLQSW